MTELSDEKFIEIGRAVHEQLANAGESPRRWPRILVFELFDHKRRLRISEVGERVTWSEAHSDEDFSPSEVKFTGGPYIV